jgi:serine/threonine protein phosphatase 1
VPAHHDRPWRTLAIGDIHGRAGALAALIEAIQPGPHDAVGTLGDRIDNGPDSRGVLAQLLALARRYPAGPTAGQPRGDDLRSH